MVTVLLSFHYLNDECVEGTMKGRFSSDSDYDSRLCGYISQALKSQSITFTSHLMKSGVDNWIRFLHKEIPEINTDIDVEQTKSLLDNIVSSALENVYKFSDFSWIEDSDRACYWVWCNIYTMPALFFLPPIKKPDVTPYIYLGCDPLPGNSRARFFNIVNFFDRWINPQDKRRFLNEMRNSYRQITCKKNALSFLSPKKKDDCLWVWHYLNERNMVGEYIAPIMDNPHEVYLAVNAAFDIWCTSNALLDETIINFSKKIKNAYAQRNFKASRKNTKDKSKKTVIATLTPELQKKLSDLSQASEMTRQEMLELCINSAYLKLPKNARSI